MKFTIVQDFVADVDDLCAAFVDESYLGAMGGLKDLGAPKLISQKRKGKVVTQQLRTSFVGKLPSVALKVIDPERLSWDEFAVIDLGKRTATFEMVPVHYQTYFTCGGTWGVDAAGDIARRTIAGTLKVSSPIPFVNSQVERAIVSGLKERLRDEPAVYARWLTRGE